MGFPSPAASTHRTRYATRSTTCNLCSPPVFSTSFIHLQTVLNTMCGYGMQQLDRGAAAQDISTVGCLEKIVRWTQTNLVLVGGLTLGLLLLEVTHSWRVVDTRPLLPWQQ